MPKTINNDDLNRDYYRLLGVDLTAPPVVVRAAYRAMMLEVGRHPDRGGDHEGAILLNRAKEILLDPVLRAQYDQLRSRLDRPIKPDTPLRRCRVCGVLVEPVWLGQKRPPDVCKKCFWSDRL